MDPSVHFQPLKMDPPVHFHPLKMDPPVHFNPLKMDTLPPPPPGQLFAVENALAPPPRNVRNIANVTPGPFSLCKMDPPGQLFAVVNAPAPHLCTMDSPDQLYAVVNGPPLGKLGILQTLPPVPFHYATWTGVHFQRRKTDRGVHFQRRKMDRGGGGPFYTGGSIFNG